MLVGKISGTSSISCSLSGSSSLAGKLLLGSTIPVYRGETSFIPSEEQQTIDTHGKAVLTNIIVYSSKEEL